MLDHSLSMMTAIIEGTSDAIYVNDRRGRYLLANAAVCRTVQKPAEQVLGQDDTALFPADEARQIMEADRLTLALARPRTFEDVATTDNGVRTYLSTKGPVYDAQGELVGLFGIARDITDCKRQAKALSAVSSRQEAILEAVPDIIAEVDVNRFYTWMNRAGFEFFGDDALGKEAGFFFEGQQGTYNTVHPLFHGDTGVIYVESW